MSGINHLYDLYNKKGKEFVKNASKVFISIDASHDPIQVNKDINTYTKYVSVDSYMIVQDTKLDRISRRKYLNSINFYIDKFLNENHNFRMDRDKELIFYFTHHPKGFLKRIS